MPLTARLQGSFAATQTGASSAIDLGTVTPATAVVARTGDLVLADGTGAGLSDVLYQDTNTLAASATIDIDLAGALAGALGGTAVFARVKGLYIAAAAANTNNVVVGAAATNAWATLFNATGTLTLRPGAWVLLGTGGADATGWAVTGGTGDLLRLTNGAAGTTVTYDIAIIGTSV